MMTDPAHIPYDEKPLLKAPSPVHTGDLPPPRVAISSRIRLARNLNGVPFPSQASDEVLASVAKLLDGKLGELPRMEGGTFYWMNRTLDVQKTQMIEDHLISRELAEGRHTATFLSEDHSISIMVNEEDHLRIQGLRGGMALREIWEDVSALDDAIETSVRYAFSPMLGYLTSCPSNVGTGLRASVLIHVPGLALLDEMRPIINGLSKIGLAVRGLWGEGSEAVGSLYQISNQMTLGPSEERIIEDLEQIVLEIVEHEQNSRIRLMESGKKEMFVRDRVGRALGILKYARILTSDEAINALSELRLGVDLGMVSGILPDVTDALTHRALPGHLQIAVRRDLKAQERDMLRARIIREALAACDINN